VPLKAIERWLRSPSASPKEYLLKHNSQKSRRGYAHPTVYVDTGGLQSSRILPRAAHFRYLQNLVESGFGERIMFGSDFPDQVEMGIDAILQASVLTDEQKSDILCNNAARFLRLDVSATSAYGSRGSTPDRTSRRACTDTGC
jgi:predicted TIM-barrel fold metal-dependent hydrolase